MKALFSVVAVVMVTASSPAASAGGPAGTRATTPMSGTRGSTSSSAAMMASTTVVHYGSMVGPSDSRQSTNLVRGSTVTATGLTSRVGTLALANVAKGNGAKAPSLGSNTASPLKVVVTQSDATQAHGPTPPGVTSALAGGGPRDATVTSYHPTGGLSFNLQGSTYSLQRTVTGANEYALVRHAAGVSNSPFGARNRLVNPRATIDKHGNVTLQAHDESGRPIMVRFVHNNTSGTYHLSHEGRELASLRASRDRWGGRKNTPLMELAPDGRNATRTGVS